MLSSANGSFVVKRRKRLDHSRINDVLSPLCSQEIVQKKNASVWKSETSCLFLREHERLGGFQRRKDVYALFWAVCQAIFWALPKIMPIPKNAVRFVFMRSFCLSVKRKIALIRKSAVRSIETRAHKHLRYLSRYHLPPCRPPAFSLYEGESRWQTQPQGELFFTKSNSVEAAHRNKAVLP